MFSFFPKKKPSVLYDQEDIDLIAEVSSSILSTLELTPLLQKAIDSVVTKYGFRGGILLLVDGDHLFAKTISQNIRSLRFLEVIKVPVSSLHIKIDEKSKNKVVRSILEKKIITTHELTDFTQEVLSPTVGKLAKTVTGVKSSISIPIIYQNKVLGALFIGDENPKGFKKELPILKLACTQIGIALVNAQLYAKIKSQVKQMEEKNKELVASRIRERDMMDIVGHELRTPLTIIKISLELMERKLAKMEDSVQKNVSVYIERIKGALDREIKLLETMLTSTKIDSDQIEMHLEKVDVKEIVKDSITALSNKAAQKSIQLITKLIEENYVFADKIRLGEVIDNLIVNAIKYTEKGSITISTSKDEKYLYIAIKDTGVGIPKADIMHLGEKFFRVGQYSTNTLNAKMRKKVTKTSDFMIVRPGGTGLGLYVTYNLVEKMNGKITVESEVGKGSTFTVILPRFVGQISTKSKKSDEKNLFKRLGFTRN